jgi:thiamine kinase-like enzyme
MKTSGSEKDFFIDRHVEEENHIRLAQLELAPKLLKIDRGKRLQYFEHLPGRILSKEDFKDGRLLPKIMRSIVSIHSCRSSLISELNPFRAIEAYAKEATRVNHSRMESLDVKRVHREVKKIEKQILRLKRPKTICHNDLTPANFIIGPTGTVRIIDWEFAAMGDPLFDLANFLSNLRSGSTNFLDKAEEKEVLDLYFKKGKGKEIVWLYTLVAQHLGVLWSLILEKRSKTSFDYENYTNTLMRICVSEMDSDEEKYQGVSESVEQNRV